MTALRFSIAIAFVVFTQVSWAQNPFVGHINALCKDDACTSVRTALRDIDAKCRSNKRECNEAADKFLRSVFGVYVPALPKYVVYLEQCKVRSSDIVNGECEVTPGKFRRRTPVLMWNGQDTGYVFGSRQIYALVFSERKACISGSVTINHRSEPNPLSILFSALGAKLDPVAQAKPSDSKAMTFRWYPLSGDYSKSGMWMALGGTPIDENTVSWITVEPSNPRPKPPAGAPTIPDECISTEPLDQVNVKIGPQSENEPAGARQLFNRLRRLDEGSSATLAIQEQELDIRTGRSRGPSKPAAEPPVKEQSIQPAPGPYSGDFLGADSFFSNSPGGRGTVAIALGATRGVGDTSLGSGGSDWSYNGYALVKFYLALPKLRPTPDSDCGYIPGKIILSKWRCPSFGLFAGTNITGGGFNEVIYGASLGHVFDNVGLVVGRNSIAGGKNGQVGRQKRPFIGVDYSF